MNTYENKGYKIFFNTATSIALVGLILYLIYEMILWIREMTNPAFDISLGAFPIVLTIANGLAAIGVILIAVLLFLGLEQTVLLRIATILGSGYFFTYALSYLFFPVYNTTDWDFMSGYDGNILLAYGDNGQNFLVLLLMGLLALFTLVITSINFQEQMITLIEKSAIIMVLVTAIVRMFTCLDYSKFSFLGLSFLFYHGQFFLPVLFEMVLVSMVIIIIALSLSNIERKYLQLFSVLLANIYIIAIGCLLPSILDFNFVGDAITYSLANIFLSLGALLTTIASVLLIAAYFPKNTYASKG
jgi:hypothetical protein